MSKELPESLKLSSIEEIRSKLKENKEGKLVRLPSGIVVKLRKPDIATLIREDIIPSDLLNMAMNMSQSNQQLDKETINKNMEVMDIIAMNSVVEPKLVKEDAKVDELLVSELPFADKVFISSYINEESKEEANRLEPFRKEGQK